MWKCTGYTKILTCSIYLHVDNAYLALLMQKLNRILILNKQKRNLKNSVRKWIGQWRHDFDRFVAYFDVLTENVYDTTYYTYYIIYSCKQASFLCVGGGVLLWPIYIEFVIHDYEKNILIALMGLLALDLI